MRVAAGVAAVGFAAWAVGRLQDVLLLIVASLVFAIGLQPAVGWLAKRMPRGAAVAVILFTLAAVTGLFLAFVLPVVGEQLVSLVQSAPKALARLQEGNGVVAQLDNRFGLVPKLQDLGGVLPSLAVTLARSVALATFGLITMFVLTGYFANALPSIHLSVARLLEREHREGLSGILDLSTTRLAYFLMGNLIISVAAGVTSFAAFLALGVPYPLVLAVWIALTDAIPTLGVFLGAGAAIVVAAFVGWPQVIGVIVFIVVYQQVENFLITPRVMKHAIDLSPASVVIAVLCGAVLFGVFGALLALPVAAVVKIVAEELYLNDRVEHVRKRDRRMRRNRTWRRNRPTATE